MLQHPLALTHKHSYYSDHHPHPSVAARALVHVRLADNEQNVLGPPQRDTRNALDLGQTELLNSLARLLLVPAVHSDLSTGRDVGLALALTALLSRVVRRVLCILNADFLLFGLVRELLDSWVGHCEWFVNYEEEAILKIWLAGAQAARRESNGLLGEAPLRRANMEFQYQVFTYN